MLETVLGEADALPQRRLVQQAEPHPIQLDFSQRLGPASVLAAQSGARAT